MPKLLTFMFGHSVGIARFAAAGNWPSDRRIVLEGLTVSTNSKDMSAVQHWYGVVLHRKHYYLFGALRDGALPLRPQHGEHISCFHVLYKFLASTNL
jgi:hypothetical protein